MLQQQHTVEPLQTLSAENEVSLGIKINCQEEYEYNFESTEQMLQWVSGNLMCEAEEEDSSLTAHATNLYGETVFAMRRQFNQE